MPKWEGKTDKLSIHTQFHVAFAPSFGPEELPAAPSGELCFKFPVHYQEIMESRHFFRAGIRDAE